MLYFQSSVRRLALDSNLIAVPLGEGQAAWPPEAWELHPVVKQEEQVLTLPQTSSCKQRKRMTQAQLGMQRTLGGNKSTNQTTRTYIFPKATLWCLSQQPEAIFVGLFGFPCCLNSTCDCTVNRALTTGGTSSKPH